MILKEKKESIIFNNIECDGFAIPQILILGIGIAVITSGIIAASLLNLTESRISRQELMAKAASESGVSSFRALLNDNSNSLFYYFYAWIMKDKSKNITLRFFAFVFLICST